MRVWVVPSMTAPKHDGKAKPVDQPSFFEADRQLIAIFLALDIVNFIEIVLHNSEMGASDQKVELSQVEHPIQECKIALFLLFEHDSLPKSGIGNGLVGIVEQLAFALKLTLSVEVEMSQKAIGSIDGLYHFPLHKFCGEETMLSEEYVVAVHEIVKVGGGDGESAVVDEYALAVLFE